MLSFALRNVALGGGTVGHGNLFEIPVHAADSAVDRCRGAEGACGKGLDPARAPRRRGLGCRLNSPPGRATLRQVGRGQDHGRQEVPRPLLAARRHAPGVHDPAEEAFHMAAPRTALPIQVAPDLPVVPVDGARPPRREGLMPNLPLRVGHVIPSAPRRLHHRALLAEPSIRHPGTFHDKRAQALANSPLVPCAEMRCERPPSPWSARRSSRCGAAGKRIGPDASRMPDRDLRFTEAGSYG